MKSVVDELQSLIGELETTPTVAKFKGTRAKEWAKESKGGAKKISDVVDKLSSKLDVNVDVGSNRVKVVVFYENFRRVCEWDLDITGMTRPPNLSPHEIQLKILAGLQKIRDERIEDIELAKKSNTNE